MGTKFKGEEVHVITKNSCYMSLIFPSSLRAFPLTLYLMQAAGLKMAAQLLPESINK